MYTILFTNTPKIKKKKTTNNQPTNQSKTTKIIQNHNHWMKEGLHQEDMVS